MRAKTLERVGLLAALLLIALALSSSKALERWNLLAYDSALWLMSAPAPDDVVLAAIDEHSLEALGRWPWPRRIHAGLVDRLTEAGVRAVAFDIVFSEPDLSDPGGDQLLAEALRRNGQVVLPVFPMSDTVGSQIRANLPLVEFQSVAKLGHVDAELDKDGLARSVYLKAGIGSTTWSHLSLALLEL
ncbi:MAG TPA: CHASE2 domain-containing protein, partial [Burkholderiales bacterium]|nr:CHASE2 domain-containing protein [Burkholderiales bacterium]